MPEPQKEEKLTLKESDSVVVRMYGQGFGDCFLLAFPRTGTEGKNNPVYVLIDSGLFFRSPKESDRMKAVAESIYTATDGVIDLLVATHEHYDHLSGFNSAKHIWKKFEVGRIWLAWTENMDDNQARNYQDDLEHLAEIKENALAMVAGRPMLARELHQIQGIIGFATAGQFKPPRDWAASTDRVLDAFAKNPGGIFSTKTKTQVEFCEPGEVLRVPQTKINAYVLGPPRDETALLEEEDPDLYSEPASNQTDQGLALRRVLAAASERAEFESLGSAIQQQWLQANSSGGREAVDGNTPFRASVGIPYEAARQSRFFQDHYFKESQGRQIEDNWLYGFSRFALQVDRIVNNTSLVLAFRLPGGNVLLFPGDAQGGNWRSWFGIGQWKDPKGGGGKTKPKPAELIKRTVVYKVGHHGSHNATLMKDGLEQMRTGVIAFVPVSKSYPQDQQEWSIPLPSLVDALKRKTGGRLVFPDKERSRADGTDTKFQPEAVFESAAKNFEDDESLPLWRQVRI